MKEISFRFRKSSKVDDGKVLLQHLTYNTCNDIFPKVLQNFLAFSKRVIPLNYQILAFQAYTTFIPKFLSKNLKILVYALAEVHSCFLCPALTLFMVGSLPK